MTERGRLLFVLFGCQKSFSQKFGRIPSGHESQNEDDGCDCQRVEEFQLYRIGVGNKHAFGTAQFQYSVFLLQIAEYDSQDESRTSPDSRNEPPFDKEDFRNESVVGSEVL